jgi:type IV secretory pathway TraG/TraD family ATPase VirD4
MSQHWGRTDEAGVWLNPKPAWTVAAGLLAVASAISIGVYQAHARWTPLQQWYLPAYTRSAVLDAVGVRTPGRYRLLRVLDSRGSRLALDDEVRPIAASGAAHAFTLTEAALAAGDQRLVWQDGLYPHATLHSFLAHWIYGDQTVAALLRPTWWTGASVFALGLMVAIPADLRRARRRRHGRRLKGPELVTVRRFNRRLRADGIAFAQRSRRGGSLPSVRLPRALESSHLLIMGDSGTGKSALIRQLLVQLAARGETAILYDPALEYLPQFYQPARGDVVLNPLDARSPYWSPSDEWRHEAETLTLATSLFPDRPHENAFFTQAPRRIFAHLLTLKPTPDDLARWLCHDEELDARLAGTPYASMIDRQAPAQRSGVLASLNMVADTLKSLPGPGEFAHRWSAADWARDRQGWLFLTSTPETRERLVPLTSLWLDTLVLRLMNQGQPHPRRTWFVLDELASLQRLPQLHTAITENRKSNNPVVLGFQGRSQLETRYGHDAEAMLSQPATKIFLRTSEPHAAKWIAESLGDIEIERLRESRSQGRSGQQSWGLERQVEPLVMASEITGLPALRGYLKTGNLVVRMQFPFIDLPNRHEAFVGRTPRGSGLRPPPTPSEVTGDASPIPAPRVPSAPSDPWNDTGHAILFD